MATLGSTESFLAQTIVYLRPVDDASAAVLDYPGNKKLVVYLPQSHPRAYVGHDTGRDQTTTTATTSSGETAAIRLGFDNKDLRRDGFSFGTEASTVKLYENKDNGGLIHFRIHYNFTSGALLVTAEREIQVGMAKLKTGMSLVLMEGMVIKSAGLHQREYTKYAAHCGFKDAGYLPTMPANAMKLGDNYWSRAIIGTGAFGEVHRVLRVGDGQQFAIKRVSRMGSEVEKEIKFLRTLRHENIVDFETAFVGNDNEMCIVMEYAVSDLHQHLEARKGGSGPSHLSQNCVQSIVRQVLSALVYLHDRKIAHRDLKTSNILVTKWIAKTGMLSIKLGDFGFAHLGETFTSQLGTHGYMAPELGVSRPLYTHSVDIWAMGEVFETLMNGMPKKTRAQKAWVDGARVLIARMKESSPHLRPTAQQCLEDAWFRTDSTSTLSLAKKVVLELGAYVPDPDYDPDQVEIRRSDLGLASVTSHENGRPPVTSSLTVHENTLSDTGVGKVAQDSPVLAPIMELVANKLLNSFLRYGLDEVRVDGWVLDVPTFQTLLGGLNISLISTGFRSDNEVVLKFTFDDGQIKDVHLRQKIS